MPIKSLCVGNLPYEVTEDDLRELFADFGPVEAVRVIEGRGLALWISRRRRPPKRWPRRTVGSSGAVPCGWMKLGPDASEERAAEISAVAVGAAAGSPRRVKIAGPGHVSRITPGRCGGNAGGVTGGHPSTSGQGSYGGFSLSLRRRLLPVRHDVTRKEPSALWYPK